MKNQTLVSQNEYHILDILGEGSTSTVYRAIKRDRSQAIQTEVALKVFSSEEQVEVWKREFSSLEKVTSPYCVRVFNFEWVMNKPALCLEMVEGLTLVELLDSQSLSEEDLIEVSAQALKGLRDLWAFGLAHGDLSPKNVMIDQNGQVKLLDFGLGNFDASLRRGTPFFVHESLIQGEEPGQKSDLFSLGRLMNWTGQRLKKPSDKLHELGSEIAEAQAPEGVSLAEDLNARNRLGKVVRENLAKKKLSQPETEEFMVQAQEYKYNSSDNELLAPQPDQTHKGLRLQRTLVASVLTLLFALVGWYLLQLKAQISSVPPPSASVQIRTKSWKEIWLDGERKGYTPATLRDVTPGSHILKWASPSGSGELVLTLKPGETKLLTDEDLSPGGE
jgi:serine/threonine protein kinase